MATQAATLTTARPVSASAGIILPSFTLWWREIVRFYRQPARVAGVVASPLVFWVVIGSGFGTSFRSGGGPGQQHYLDYFYPGALIMIVLFTSIFAMMSVIEDRKEGFLLSVMAAPVPRSAIVLGKVLGGTTLAAAQGMIFLIFAPFAGVHVQVVQVLLVGVVVFLVSFSLTALGFAIAWPMDSSQAFHGIVNLFLIPMWLVSGTLFAGYSPSVVPDQFQLLLSILFLAAVVLGGSGNLPGVILGAFLVGYLPERFRGFQEKRIFLFGLALVIMMIFRPQGILPSRQRTSELEFPQDQPDDSPLAGADIEDSFDTTLRGGDV